MRDAAATRWRRREAEIAACDGFILHARREDFPLRDALVEIGIAMGLGKPVAVCIIGVLELQGQWLELVDSFVHHPRCEIFTSLDEARNWIWSERVH